LKHFATHLTDRCSVKFHETIAISYTCPFGVGARDDIDHHQLAGRSGEIESHGTSGRWRTLCPASWAITCWDLTANRAGALPHFRWDDRHSTAGPPKLHTAILLIDRDRELLHEWNAEYDAWPIAQ